MTSTDPKDLDDQARPETDARLRWGIAGFLGLVVLLAVVALVLEITNLRPDSEAVDAEREARSDVIRVAERFAVQLNNYDAASIDEYQQTVTPMLSPKFKAEFEKAMTNIVASVKQSKMTSKGRVLTSGVASLDPDSAEVLVVSDANVKTVFDSRARHFRWEVSLVKIDGEWLIDNFTPVA